MIKINILNNKVSTSDEMQFGQGISLKADGVSEVDQKDIAIKLVIMAIPVVILFGYETFVISELQAKHDAVNKVVQSQNNEINSLKNKAGRAQQYEGEAKKLEEKLNILMKLSKKRLRELKALDFLQNVIPDGVWLSFIDYDGKNVTFKGGALNDKELGTFVGALETSNYFQSVVVLKAVEVRDKKTAFKEFEISTVMGAEE